MCTESLTLAYLFWQQIKRSDEKLLTESRRRLSIKKDVAESNVNNTSIDLDDGRDQLHSDKSIDFDGSEKAATTEPIQKKFRKRKSKSCAAPPPENSEIKIEANIGLPHFVIACVDTDADGKHDTINSDDLYSADDAESQQKKVKTLKASAMIPSNLDKINELLMMSPLENDGDTQSIWQCSHCPKAFAASNHLMIHMRKSHICQYCLAAFSKINELYCHVKVMHKTFDCLLCGKGFQSNGNLRQHMRKNHSIFLPAHISLLNISDVNYQEQATTENQNENEFHTRIININPMTPT